MAKWRNFFRSCHMVPRETLHVENGMEELKTFDEMIWSEGLRTTLPKTNIAPENRPLEKEIPIGNHHF